MSTVAVLYSSVVPSTEPLVETLSDKTPPNAVPVSSEVLASRADNACVAHTAARALQSRGHSVVCVGIWDRVPVEALRRYDAVLNLCEGLAGDAGGEAVAAQQLVDAGIPFSGNLPEALRLCQRKELCRERLLAAGVPVPAGAVLREVPSSWPEGLPAPCIVKPAWEDASEGIDANQVVLDLPGLQAAVRRIVGGMSQPAVCEAFIDGREITASLLGSPVEVLPLGEIDFTRVEKGRPRIVCYKAKWCPESTEYATTPSVTCRLDAATSARVRKVARQAAAALGLSDIARLDLRLEGRKLYVIDVNPNCDLGDGSGFSRAGARAGLSYPELVERVMARALAQSRAPQRRFATA